MSIILYISEQKVLSLLAWDDVFKATETAIRSVAERRVTQNPRSCTRILQTNSCLFSMPGYLRNDKFGALACKLVTMFPNNSLQGNQPTIGANIMLFDEENGALKAIIGAAEITKWRTAAASAVATKSLTRGKNLQTLAILGAGEQGRIHAEAFHHFFKFKEIRIWNHNFPKAQNLVVELRKSIADHTFKAVKSNEECVRGADVIITATFSNEPIVEFEWLQEGVHINAVGVSISHCAELSQSIYLSSDVYVDHLEGAKVELADLEKLGIEFKGEVGALITNDLPPPPPNHITVFQSLGMAVEDCAMARMIYDLHAKKDHCKAK